MTCSGLRSMTNPRPAPRCSTCAVDGICGGVPHPEDVAIRQERHYGQFIRQLTVGADVDAKAISAKFDHGVLTLELPKPRPLPEASKRITIQ